jgi:hypothetical protein
MKELQLTEVESIQLLITLNKDKKKCKKYKNKKIKKLQRDLTK